MLSEPLQPSF